MEIERTQYKSKPRKIGRTTDGDEVYEVMTKGGLVVVERWGKGKRKTTLGVGPHRKLAHYLAQQKLGKELEMLELSKSEGVGPEYWYRQVPMYQDLTDRFNKRG